MAKLFVALALFATVLAYCSAGCKCYAIFLTLEKNHKCHPSLIFLILQNDDDDKEGRISTNGESGCTIPGWGGGGEYLIEAEQRIEKKFCVMKWGSVTHPIRQLSRLLIR